MEDFSKVDIRKLEGYFRGKAEYERLFPEIYEWIGKRVIEQLSPEFPGAFAIVGPKDRENAMARHPQVGEKVPLDWVAFGYRPFDLYDIHVGVIFMMEDWPACYHIGFHALEPYWQSLEPDLKRIDWETALGSIPEYEFAEKVREYRRRDPSSRLDFSNLESELDRVVHRVVSYYGITAPLVARIRP